MKEKNTIILSKPGAGKGTIAKKFIKENKYTLITTGDIFREERNSGSELGKLINETIGSGKLVSDDITNRVVENKLNNAKGPYLFDGYPRTKAQAEFLEEKLKIDLVVYLEVTDDVVIERIVKRGETSGRDDDKDINAINKRLIEFKKETQPLFDFYSERGVLYTINAENTIDEVFNEFTNLVNEEVNEEKEG